MYIGIDIGGTSVKIGFFSESLELLNNFSIPTNQDGNLIFKDIYNAVNEQLSMNNLSFSDVKSLGAGIPGPVDSNGYIDMLANLGWESIEAKKEMEKIFGLPAVILNDANAAALGELSQEKGYIEDLIFITLGTGVGGGVVVNSSVVNGSCGAGGEVGHLKVSNDKEFNCGCGSYGCLETYTSATGIVKLARRAIKTKKPTKMQDTNTLSAKIVFDLAKKGDSLANEVIDEFADILGGALANLAVILNPNVFVIGGGVSLAGDFLIEKLEKGFENNVRSFVKNTKIRLSVLQSNAGIYGAAYAAKKI